MELPELAALLRKEQLNSYGILAPLQLQPQAAAPAGDMDDGDEDDEDDEGGRVLRGSGVYVHASLINHECNPNVARYDYFDAPKHTPSLPAPSTTHVVFRAMHDLPPGERGQNERERVKRVLACWQAWPCNNIKFPEWGGVAGWAHPTSVRKKSMHESSVVTNSWFSLTSSPSKLCTLCVVQTPRCSSPTCP